MKIHSNYIYPLEFTKTKQRETSSQLSVSGKTFKNHLESFIHSETSLSISKHAEHRLQERNINISEDDWHRIEDKVKRARSMGVNESLVLLQDAALIVSAKNNTVITAMNREEASSQIFTNINGTIIIE